MRAVFLALPLLGLGVPATAQSMDHSNMPGMQMPGMKMGSKPAAKPKAKPKTSVSSASRKRSAPRRARAAPPRSPQASKPVAGASPAADPHAGHNMADMPGMNMESSSTQAAPDQPAQGHDMSAMPGMEMGQQPAADPHAGHDMSAMPGMSPSGGQAAQPMPGHDMSAMQGMENGQMQGMDHSQMPGMDHGGMAGMKMGPSGTVKPVTGSTTAPPPPSDHAADLIWDPEAMRGARADLRTETGGQSFYMVLFNLAEYQAKKGRDGYRWDGEAWYGGDINRLTLKTEGEGAFREGLESAEIQAVYSRSIGPYWFVQGGLRYDIKPNPSRTYATIGIEGLAPNNFDVEGALFLSDRGDVLGRIEGYYDQRVTQRLILQPRAEFNLSAQDVRAEGYGSGLVDAELGLRLRYEVRREFAPYIVISWERQFGDTRRFSRLRNQETGGFSFVAGVRTWF